MNRRDVVSTLKQNVTMLCGLALVILMAAPAVAAEDFYRGKQIAIMAGGGGSYEFYARMLAKYMPKYIPGSPTMIVKNMAGASGLKVTNYIYNVAPKDGTEIGAGQGHIPTLPLFNAEGVQYDPAKLPWIGNPTKEVFIGYVWHTSPVQSLEEARSKEAVVGGQSVGAMSVDIAILANAMIGTKFKIVTGYAGSAETMLAVERGEVNGHLGTPWTTLSASKPDWIKQKLVKVIAQFGQTRHKDLPDVPLLLDYVTKPEDRSALEAFLARQETAKPYFVPPGTPADRVTILRRAFDSAVKDPEFLAEVTKANFDVTEPMTGEEMEVLVARMSKIPPTYTKRINDAFAAFSAK